MAAQRLVPIGSSGLAGGLVIGALVGALVGVLVAPHVLPDPAPPPSTERGEGDLSAAARLASRFDEITAELDTAREEESLLRAELARARRALAEREPEALPAGTAPGTARFLPTSGPGRMIRDLAEAEAAYQRALAAGDLEGLWLLGADLLAFGEEGYPLFERLLERFLADADRNAAAFMALWNEEELWLGRFLRPLAEEHESFLAYGLTLVERDESELSPALASFRRELFDDEILPTLLAFHGGENADLTEGWLAHLESRFALADLGGVDPETLLFSIAQIPGDRSAELLIHWLETHADHRDDAIDALLLQGSPRAASALRNLLPAIEDESLRAAIERRIGS